MFSVQHYDNSQHQIDFALSSFILQTDGYKPEGEPTNLPEFARGVLVNQGAAVMAAFEVVTFLKSNFSFEIPYNGGTCRLLSGPDLLKMAKHTMHLLVPILEPYKKRIARLKTDQLRELAHRIAGIYQRDHAFNLLTGNGLHFTGLSSLYYNRTSLKALESFKLLIGWRKNSEHAIYSLASLPSLTQVDRIVSEIMRG